MLNEFLFTKTEEKEIGNIWFQQNAHTAEATFNVLRHVFADRGSQRDSRALKELKSVLHRWTIFIYLSSVLMYYIRSKKLRNACWRSGIFREKSLDLLRQTRCP